MKFESSVMSTYMTSEKSSFWLGCICGGICSISLYLIAEQARHCSSIASTAAEDMNGSDNFIAAGKSMLHWIVQYRTKEVKRLPVISKVEPNYLCKVLPDAAPGSSEPWRAILGDLTEKILPGLTNWESSSKFFAYFKPHASYPAVLGELLCAGLNVMGFDWIASPACTELEVIVLDWLAKFLNLPAKFHNLHDGPGK